MIKLLFVFGTRPEAIKMAPVILEAARHKKRISAKVCVTAQHRHLLDQVLGVFGIKPDYDLNIMQKNQSLFGLTAGVLTSLQAVLEREKPDVVLVQGDTTTAFAGALAAFYAGARVGHIEAGLRTHDKLQPFPEEVNRKCADALTDIYFAPTRLAAGNLLREGVRKKDIRVTGNTIVDAIRIMRKKLDGIDVRKAVPGLDLSRRLVLVTAHRRESFNGGIDNICRALKKLAAAHADIEVVYPVHPNPSVIAGVKRVLRPCPDRIHLVEPVDYFTFLKLASRAHLILSDSGGVQEEAPSFKKPVLIMRNVTERPEILHCGLGKLVGTDTREIVRESEKILRKSAGYYRRIKNPFGDGHASRRIIEALLAG